MDIQSGAIAALLGPSGCGKTSLIHIIAGLRRQSSGEVTIDGQAVHGVRKQTAVIFQDYGLLPWKTVVANAELPLRLARVPKRERMERTRRLLEEFQLERFGEQYPSRLSGGMKQRLAIARALASEPDLLLMDEPFSSLDALSREEAQRFLLSIRQKTAREKRRFTIIMVTHSIEEAVYLADTVFVIKGRNPGVTAARVDNEKGLDADFRKTASFYERCGIIRELLEK
ncbi:MAG: ABC transporter ATP-binding protein [Treponema sp.]|jgi:NitT/TauT family transport system ATP-binding protein|nr:ABC transporter ATP-binding protein [Treponema sp.]